MRPAGLFLSLFCLLQAVTSRLSSKDKAFLLSYLGEDFSLATPTEVSQPPAETQGDLEILDQHEHHHTHKERHHHKAKGRL